MYFDGFMKFGWNCPLSILKGSQVRISKVGYISVPEDRFELSKKCVDPDEMPHYVAFHLDLHILPKYLFRGFQNTKDI